MYTIGRLAKRAKVNADTIRFYERQGLVAAATKTESGYRLYTDCALRKILFIKHAQRCGFSLADIAALLQMHSPLYRSDACRLVAEKQAQIRSTIESLETMSEALSRMLVPGSGESDCGSTVDPDESPLLVALESLSHAKAAAGQHVNS